MDASTTVTSSAVETRELHVWPNPASDVLMIEGTSSAAQADVLDITGRVVVSERMNGTRSAIDIASLSSGMYTLRVHAGDRMITCVFTKY